MNPFEFSHPQTVQKLEYYTQIDLFQEMGGLAGSVISAIGIIGTITAILFKIDLGRVIRRKDKHLYNLKLIKQYMKLLEEIRPIIVYR